MTIWHGLGVVVIAFLVYTLERAVIVSGNNIARGLTSIADAIRATKEEGHEGKG
jgi:hypothetical protein